MIPDSLTTNTMDRLLDMLSEGVVFIADKIQTVAPEVWAMAQRQVIAEATVDLWIAIVVTVVGIILVLIGVYIYKHANDEEPAIPFFMLGGIGTMAGLIFTIAFARDYFLITTNPDYYTIKRLIEMVSGNL